MKKTVIIGGGAAGMTAAIASAGAGDAVTLLEHSPQLGKKLLSTGNGRCNLTNRNQDASFYRCSEADFPEKALRQFGYKETLDFFRGLGLFFKEKDGYVYPRSSQASSVRNALLRELERRKADLRMETDVQEIVKRGKEFTVKTSESSFASDRVILACGGMAAPSTGSDGSGYQLAAKMGHRIIEPVPALVQLRSSRSALQKAAGVRADGRISLYIMENGGRAFAGADTGEIQLTDYGISGIPVFQVSRYASKALSENKQVWAEIDFLPEYTSIETKQELFQSVRLEKKGYDCLEVLCGLFPEKLALAFLKEAGIPFHFPAEQLDENRAEKLCRTVTHFSVPISGTNSFSQAQVTAGGVDVRDVTPESMESKLVPGLYFAGEILDVDGICGGYNLQWAWTSGWLAGRQGRK